MLIFLLLLSVLVGFSVAKPSDYSWPKNVVTVPPNCPVGQEWVNGECRDIWIIKIREAMKQALEAVENIDDSKPHNVITVPPNCRPGQQWVNGQCRDVWKQNDVAPEPVNLVTVPPNCPVGQEYVNGECRDIWKRSPLLSGQLEGSTMDNTGTQTKSDEEMGVDIVVGTPDRNIINVPNQCPVGFKPDALGFCRPIFGKIMI